MNEPRTTTVEHRRIVTELDALQAEVDALKRLQAETAVELDALLDQTGKIDTSPFILSPFEAERRAAILDRAFKGEL